MKKISLIIILVCAISVCFLPEVEALTLFNLVNTEPGSSTSPGGAALNSSQWLAFQISTDGLAENDYYLKEFGMWAETTASGRVSGVLYSDENGLPGTALFEKDQFVVASQTPSFLTFNNFNATIKEDEKYWVALEIGASSSYAGFVSGPSANPLPFGQAANNLTSIFGEYQITGDDLPVFANATVAPEPATMLLFTTGLAGAFIRRRKKII